MSTNTRAKILNAALKLCRKKSYHELRMLEVAEAADVVKGTVVLYFLNMKTFRRDLVRHAVECGNNRVIAQAISAGDPVVRRLSPAEKQRAMSNYAE